MIKKFFDQLMKKNKHNQDKAKRTTLLPHLSNEVVFGISGFQLDSYLMAYEGWRRGLTLTWYQDEAAECKLHRLNSSTHGKFFSLSSADRQHHFFRTRGDKVANKTVVLCQNKEKTKALLHKKGVPVPIGKLFKVEQEKEIIKFAEETGFPVVLKPVSGSMGKGVFTNIASTEELQETLQHFRSNYSYRRCLVEKHYDGNEYRVYVVGDRVIGATNRIPANITGDGKSSIKTLIEQKNAERKQNPYLAIKPIKIDFEIENMLKKNNLDENSILKKNQQIFLRELSNLSAGGDPIDATNELSEEVKQIAVNALKAMPSIPHAGVDVIVDSQTNKSGVILEINATAEIGFHLFPLIGEARDIPAAIMDYYFPETVGKETTQFYFDYKSILEPLNSWSAHTVQVTPAPLGEVYAITYTVTGKVRNVGYLRWIRRQALSRQLHGYAKSVKDNTIEVLVASTNQQEVEDFKKICEKGSKKSRVEHVVGQRMKIEKDRFLKIGFDI